MLGVGALFCGVSACGAPQDVLTGKVGEVVERSKTTQATYAAYTWNRVTNEGKPPREFWSAEFNAGNLHRVESPDFRFVADCRARTGTALFLASGETITGAKVAAVDCGISTSELILASEWLGTVQTSFGRADRVRLTVGETVRTYDVGQDGVLLREVIASKAPRGQVEVEATAFAVLPTLPDANMFDAASIQRSYVPDQYKSPPKPSV
jgi:hypothetical protein